MMMNSHVLLLSDLVASPLRGSQVLNRTEGSGERNGYRRYPHRRLRLFDLLTYGVLDGDDEVWHAHRDSCPADIHLSNCIHRCGPADVHLLSRIHRCGHADVHLSSRIHRRDASSHGIDEYYQHQRRRCVLDLDRLIIGKDQQEHEQHAVSYDPRKISWTDL